MTVLELRTESLTQSVSHLVKHWIKEHADAPLEELLGLLSRSYPKLSPEEYLLIGTIAIQSIHHER